jgi:dihydrofolate synthase/folylpolyglutamate synthase
MADFARSESPAVQAQLDRLAKLSPAGDRLGLERISGLLERLGRPQDRLPPVIHVAGTNGKGSTCAILRAMLEAEGLKVHVFTSPHLVRFNERIRVAGELIGDEELSQLLERVLSAGADIQASFFEVTTAVALIAFADTPADACILEVGLGGRLDATNIIEHPLVCAIAGLGIDHTNWLGRTLAEIAGEKAGIAKRGVPLVTQRYPPEAAQRVQQMAEATGAQWIARGALWDSRLIRDRIRYHDRHGRLDLPLPKLPGRHQADNAALAVAILRHQDRLQVSAEAMEGIRTATWPARLEKLETGALLDRLPRGSELWVDGGHNGAAARQVADYASGRWGGALPLVLIFAALKTKDPKSLLRPFAGMASAVHTLAIPGHESRSPGDLAALAKELGFEATANDDLQAALEQLVQPARVLIFGSLYLAGQALKANGTIPD